MTLLGEAQSGRRPENKGGSVMKSFRFCSHAIVVLALVGAILAFAAPANALWYRVHGTGAQMQDTASPHWYMGWGLDINQNPGSSNWIHLPVPTVGSPMGVSQINVFFYTGSIDVWVAQVDVWDGNTKIKSFTGTWTQTNAYRSLTLTLPARRVFTSGLGISVLVKAGVESMSHRVIMVRASANFTSS
jgi:hypothetical protein